MFDVGGSGFNMKDFFLTKTNSHFTTQCGPHSIHLCLAFILFCIELVFIMKNNQHQVTVHLNLGLKSPFTETTFLIIKYREN